MNRLLRYAKRRIGTLSAICFQTVYPGCDALLQLQCIFLIRFKFQDHSHHGPGIAVGFLMQINDGQRQKQVGVFRIVHDGILVFRARLVVAMLTWQQAGKPRM